MARTPSKARAANPAAFGAIPDGVPPEIVAYSGVGDLFNVFAFDPATGTHSRFVRQVHRNQIPPQLLSEMRRFSNAMLRHWTVE